MWRWKRNCIGAIACVTLAPGLGAADGLGEGSHGSVLGRGDQSGIVAWHRTPGQGSVLEHRRTSTRYASHQESYFTLKGGGLRIGDDPTLVGAFLGLELGGAIENVFEMGLSVDYYYREVENAIVLDQSSVAELPVQVLSAHHTSAHLVPVGLSLRLRLPTGTLWPFVSTTLDYEWLYLDNAGTVEPLFDSLAGLGIQLASKVALMAEAGYHWGAPSQEFVLDGRPVELRVSMDGPYVRGGIRFGL
jgi:hypothetical protein